VVASAVTDPTTGNGNGVKGSATLGI